jgi:hypothetical protein
MSIQIIGSGGTVLDTDTNKNVLVRSGLSSSGHFTTIPVGIPGRIANTTRAKDVTLAWIYFLGKGNQKAYIHKFDISMVVSNVTVAPITMGAIGLQRFRYLTLSPTSIPIPNMLKIGVPPHILSQGSNADIVMTDAIFGTDIVWWRVPCFISDATIYQGNYQPTCPTVLRTGDGLALRIREANAPGGQTWVYNFLLEWSEE